METNSLDMQPLYVLAKEGAAVMDELVQSNPNPTRERELDAKFAAIIDELARRNPGSLVAELIETIRANTALRKK